MPRVRHLLARLSSTGGVGPLREFHHDRFGSRGNALPGAGRRLVPGSGQAADEAFRRDDLSDSAIKLEAQIKSEAGPVAKSGVALRTDADAAFKRSDFRTGLQILGKISSTT